MNGLLEVLGGALSGGGKGFAEGWAEKTKTEAQALRDENIARLEGMRQQMGFEHSERLQEKGLKHAETLTDKQIAAGAAEGEKTRAHRTTQSVLEAGMREGADIRKGEREEISKTAQFEREEKSRATEFDRRLTASLANTRATVQEQNKAKSETMKLRDELIGAGMPAASVNQRVLDHIAPDKSLIVEQQKLQLKLEELKNKADTYIKASNLLMKENDTAVKPLTAEEIDTKAWEMTEKAFRKPGVAGGPKEGERRPVVGPKGEKGTAVFIGGAWTIEQPSGKPATAAPPAPPKKQEPKPRPGPTLVGYDEASAANLSASDKERAEREAAAGELHGKIGQFFQDRMPKPGLREIKPKPSYSRPLGQPAPAEAASTSGAQPKPWIPNENDLRSDGTPKGNGWLGVLPITYPDGKTGAATEYTVGVSIGGKNVDIPTLVPTLSKEEVNLMVTDIIPNHKKVPDQILQKAIAFAKSRLAEGKSVFAEDEYGMPGGSPGGGGQFFKKISPAPGLLRY